jgi:UDPglucose 6-dehydrogenase
MILTPWPQYRQVTPLEIAQALSGKIVIDPYAVLDHAGAAKAGLAYFTLGRAAIAAS